MAHTNSSNIVEDMIVIRTVYAQNKGIVSGSIYIESFEGLYCKFVLFTVFKQFDHNKELVCATNLVSSSHIAQNDGEYPALLSFKNKQTKQQTHTKVHCKRSGEMEKSESLFSFQYVWREKLVSVLTQGTLQRTECSSGDRLCAVATQKER